ncbi:MAG TPA: glycosyltransferase family A protein [Gemmatimonadaceae bacterium]|nr:glycosyltransferase family A protein [Gemmatimonadaceae bacterium]
MSVPARDEIAVSVVIATRNRRPLLAEAIQSVRAQEGVAFEIIVSDDASEDDTWDFLSAQDDVRSFRQEERGERSRARNHGLANARGRYVMFLDDDDLLEPRALATLSRALDDNPDAIAAAGARLDWFVAEKWVRRDSHPRFERKGELFDAFVFGWSAISGQNLYRTGAVRKVGGYDDDISYTEDRDLWLKVSRLGPVVLRPEAVMKYRIPRVQDRPPDIAELRERTVQRAIDRIPEADRPAARVIRQASVLVNEAEDHLQRRELLLALRCIARAYSLAPRLLRSPLIGAWVLRRLGRRAGHILRLH